MQIRTDLAMEGSAGAQVPGAHISTCDIEGSTRHEVTIETEEAAQALQKPRGRYVTICDARLKRPSAREREQLGTLIGEAVREMTPPFGDILVVGLGNRHITADALGARVVESMLVTRHMLSCAEEALCGRLRGVCAIAPGVLGVTGMETAEMIRGIVERVKPSAVIAVDALAARESARIGATVQVTDTGISPGSGVGNHRLGLSRDTLTVPVIAVGVPTVVYASTIVRDALMRLGGEEGEIDALVGGLSELQNMVMTPREVDEMVAAVAQVLALGVNIALQARLQRDEIAMLMNDSL